MTGPVLAPIAEAERYEQERGWTAANPNYRTTKMPTVDPLRLMGKPVPARRWTVRDWIPHGAVTLLGGDGGVGKSLLAMMLLTAAATGKAWLGQETMPCRTLGVFCEDDADELHRRQVSINEHYGIEFGDLENLLWASRVGEDSVLMRFDREDNATPTEKFQQVHDAAQDHGAQLVVLDSLHDLFGGNENFRPQARAFINLLRSLARDCDGAVVLCAHPSLSGLSSGSGMSGSTAWNNAVRSRLYLTKPKGDDGEDVDDLERVLSKMKANYSGAGDALKMRWEDGVFKPEERQGGVFGNIERRSTETIFLEALDKLNGQGRRVNATTNQPSYAPRLMLQLPACKGLRRRDLERAMNSLFEGGEIRIKTEGKGHHQRSYLVRASEAGEG